MDNLQRTTIFMKQPRITYFRIKRDKFQGRATLLVVPLALMLGCESRLRSPENSPIRVRVVVASVVSCPVTKSLTGEFRASVESDMSFRTGGRIEQRIAEVGQHVAVGDLLAKLDSIQQAADVDAAKASVRSAQAEFEERNANFKRIEQLLPRMAASKEEFDNATAEALAAKAKLLIAKGGLELAELQLSYTDLRATVAGVVTTRQAEAGQVVVAGAPVYTIAVDGERDVVLDAFPPAPPEKNNIDLSLQSDPSIKAVGFIREMSPKIDPTNGTVRVKVGVKNPPDEMRLGSIVVGVAHFEPVELIRLPWSSLSRQGDQPAVWFVDSASNRVSQQVITVQSYSAGEILVSAGLNDGDLVVVSGAQLIRPGQVVNPVRVESQP